MRIALVAPSSDPLATHLDPRSAAEASRVISLARSLATVGHRITVYARKDSDALPESAIAAPGVTIEHVPAGPAASAALFALLLAAWLTVAVRTVHDGARGRLFLPLRALS